MPNHVLNKVTITGSKSAIEKCKGQIINSKDASFSFQSILPRPSSLDIESSSRVEKAVDAIKSGDYDLEKEYPWMKGAPKEELIEMANAAIKNVELYGVRDWYDWNILNWGTKWDCYEVSVLAAETSITLEFWTAWSTPVPVFRKLSEQYPTLSIEVKYADEDLGCNCGIYTFENGEEYGEPLEDFQFACELWGIDAESEVPEC